MSREDEMVFVAPGVFCDPEIADLVRALNRGGIKTFASCSGHGHRPGSIALSDGRWLLIAKDEEEFRKLDLSPVDINGDKILPVTTET